MSNVKDNLAAGTLGDPAALNRRGFGNDASSTRRLRGSTVAGDENVDGRVRVEVEQTPR